MSYRVLHRQIHPNTTIHLTQMLPQPGEILVEPGQMVQAGDAIGQIRALDDFVVEDVAALWGLPELDLAPYMLKSIGETVDMGELIAEKKGRFSFLSKTYTAPAPGTLSLIKDKFLLIETDSYQDVIQANVSAQVTAVYPNQGVQLEVKGAYIEAAYGLGEQGRGTLKSPSYDPMTNLDETSFDLLDRQTIFMAGGTIDEAGLRKAEEMGVAGLILGSIETSLLALNPPPKIPIVVTEGFGHKYMGMDIFTILQAREGDEVFIYGSDATDKRSVAKRPLIIIPGLPETETPITAIKANGLLDEGSRVRTLREPQAMHWTSIEQISSQPQLTVGGLYFSGPNMITANEQTFTPWLNFECVE